MGPRSPMQIRAIIRGKDMAGHTQRHSAVSGAKMTEPIDLPFVLWTRVAE